jgi:hypothetical protein
MSGLPLSFRHTRHINSFSHQFVWKAQATSCVNICTLICLRTYREAYLSGNTCCQAPAHCSLHFFKVVKGPAADATDALQPWGLLCDPMRWLFFPPFPSNGAPVENRRTRGKTCPSATLSTTNPTWTDPGSNPGLRGGRPAANRLSHGTAEKCADIKALSPSTSIECRRFYRHLKIRGPG